MDSDRCQQIENIFQSAIDCEPDRRGALLDAACAGDAALRGEVESLLASYSSSGFTGNGAVPETVEILERRAHHVTEGKQIGPYRILREIGQGGMGIVYLAARADEAFQKLVAIKIIKRGLDTDAVVRRFRSERQILATLDHPHITRLLDGGSTDDGLPYFVMEYIEGSPIDEYCDEHRLSVTDRLKLFQNVCAAVRYAHQNLVVHRDIKPSNVLVTKQGVPRLLDFGIAKLLAPGEEPAEATVTMARRLTPEYASPEQVRGEPITTASDVYSLGVLLYKLLTGRSPYRVPPASATALERAICDQEPERPSVAVVISSTDGVGRTFVSDESRTSKASDRSVRPTRSVEGTPDKLRRRLAGDLDNIILMALRKDPRRRYASAEQLSEDIGRHLDNLPVIARPDTPGYRATKFIQRHTTGVAATALIFLTLTGGIVATLRQARIARQERDHARLEQAKAQRLNVFLQDMVGFSDTRPFSPNRNKGHDVTLADMLDDAAQRIETELADQPDVKTAMLRTLGSTYTSQAKFDLAERYLKEAYELDLKIYGPDHLDTAQAMSGIGAVSYLKGDFASAQPWFQKSLGIYRKHVNDAGFDLRLFVGLLSDAAFATRAQGHFDDAEALWREALTYGPRLDKKYRSMAIFPKNFLAQLYMDHGDLQKAEPLAQQAVDELRALGTDRYPLAESLIDLGSIRGLQGRYSEAEALIREGTGLFGQVMGEQHPNVAYGWWNLAAVHYYQGRYDLAEKDGRTALQIVEHAMPKGANAYANCYVIIARALNKTGRSRQAEPLLRQALAIREQKVPRHSNYMANTLGALGECLATQKKYAEAEPLLTESYTTLKSIHVPQSPILHQAAERLIGLYENWGKPQEASRYRTALAVTSSPSN